MAVGLINERGHLVLWDDTRWPETVINREHAVTPPQPRNGRNGSAVSTQAGMGPPYQPRGMGAAGLPSTTAVDRVCRRVCAGQSGQRMIIGACVEQRERCAGRSS